MSVYINLIHIFLGNVSIILNYIVHII